MGGSKKNVVQLTDEFLKKREGIDKVLKLTRYASKLAGHQLGDGSELGARLKLLDSHLGVTRKAFRLGKFLGNGLDVQKALRAEQFGIVEGLQAAGAAADTVYYFLEQVMWLLKAGVVKDKELEKKLARVEACFELAGYIAALIAGGLLFQRLQEKEAGYALKSLGVRRTLLLRVI